jgi:hypothetical protein
VVLHAYNSSYSGGRDQENHGLRETSLDKKLPSLHLNKTRRVWWCMPVIPATQEVYTQEGCSPRLAQEKAGPCLKKAKAKKGLRMSCN